MWGTPEEAITYKCTCTHYAYLVGGSGLVLKLRLSLAHLLVEVLDGSSTDENNVWPLSKAQGELTIEKRKK